VSSVGTLFVRIAMESSQSLALKYLLESQQVGSLATLHRGAPAVSMVPYVLLPQGRGFVLHVSRLAAHTADMLANPAVALLVVAPPDAAASPQELPRASVRGTVRQCASGSAEHSQARALYLARFPQSAEMFSFSDFSLFIVEPRSVRFVGGFGRASSILADEFVSIMSLPTGEGAS
jgi:putative heme iron utilization protein